MIQLTLIRNPQRRTGRSKRCDGRRTFSEDDMVAMSPYIRLRSASVRCRLRGMDGKLKRPSRVTREFCRERQWCAVRVARRTRTLTLYVQVRRGYRRGFSRARVCRPTVVGSYVLTPSWSRRGKLEARVHPHSPESLPCMKLRIADPQNSTTCNAFHASSKADHTRRHASRSGIPQIKGRPH